MPSGGGQTRAIVILILLLAERASQLGSSSVHKRAAERANVRSASYKPARDAPDAPGTVREAVEQVTATQSSPKEMTMTVYMPAIRPDAFRWLRLLTMTVFMGLLSAQVATAADGDEKNSLTGNWLTSVVRPAPLPVLLSLQTYFADGNALDESNSTVIRSLGHGHWQRDGHATFTRFTLNFTFDAARNFTGTTERTTRIMLSADGQTYSSLSTVTRRFDAAGNLISTVADPAGIETARRF
jgi:hypothetical protein